MILIAYLQSEHVPYRAEPKVPCSLFFSEKLRHHGRFAECPE